VGWGPRREVVLEKGIGGGAIGGIVIVSLGPLFIVVAFLSQTSLDLKATGHTGPGGPHTLL
jgi:hypothetical protein